MNDQNQNIQESYIGTGFRATVAEALSISGKGLHSGETVTLKMFPAAAGTGLVFLPVKGNTGKIPVSPFYVTDTRQAVTIGNRDWEIRTVEHLLAALAAAGVTDAYLEVDAPEIPIMDGSSQPFYDALMATGVQQLDEVLEPIRLTTPIWVVDGDRYLVALPHENTRVTYSIDFDHPALRGQTLVIDLDREKFVSEISSARTFGFYRDLEAMQAKGLARGASAENAVVLTDDGFMNERRYENECVRHKVLDLIGDLYLIGRPIQAHIIAHRAGHTLDVALAKQILTRAAMDELASRKTRVTETSRPALELGVRPR